MNKMLKVKTKDKTDSQTLLSEMQVDKNGGTFAHRLIGYQQVDLIISITDHFIKTFNDSASNTCTDCLSRQTHRASDLISCQ